MTRVTAKAEHNHAVSLARYRRKTRAAVLPVPSISDPRPVCCEPFRPHSADIVQRLRCARRRECLNVASLRNWPAFTCEHCAVRETVVDEARPLRQSWDGVMPVDTSRR